MDSTLFVPLIDAIYNLVGAADAKWAAIVGMLLLLLRAGVIRFPFSLPFKTKPVDPEKQKTPIPDQPAPPVPVGPADPADALRDLLKKLADRFRDRLSRQLIKQAELALPLAEEEDKDDGEEWDLEDKVDLADPKNRGE